MAFKFALGAEVKDKLSNYQGLITSRTEFLYGCLRYGVTAVALDKDGFPVKGIACDEGSLEHVSAGVSETAHEWTAEGQASKTGGPVDLPARREDVSR